MVRDLQTLPVIKLNVFFPMYQSISFARVVRVKKSGQNYLWAAFVRSAHSPGYKMLQEQCTEISPGLMETSYLTWRRGWTATENRNFCFAI